MPKSQTDYLLVPEGALVPQAEKDTCKGCGGLIIVMCMKNTGYCCQNCAAGKDPDGTPKS